jgi:hypothetical protein
METAADFANLEHLDLKLWAALACPVKGLAFDTKTLALLDEDKDGRIRAPEVIAASKWCVQHLNSLDGLAKGGQPLPISQISTTTPEGEALKASAERILASLGQEDGSLSVADATAAAEALAKAAFNGDGVVPASSTEDEALQAVIAEIITALGAEVDLSGEDGVNQAKVDAFFTDAQAIVDWDAGSTEEQLVLGDGTAAAADAVFAMQAKVEDFFARCRLAAFDERALVALNRKEEEYLAIAAEDLSVTADEVSGFPLARIEAARTLPLTGPVNPAWASALSTLHTAAVQPILGETVSELSEADWKSLLAKLTPFQTWRGTKPSTAVNDLSMERIQELLAGDLKERLTALVAKDLAEAAAVGGAAQVERLVRYHSDLFQLAQNFVNLSHFYSDTERATFEAGTLYLDERACHLVVRVDDAGTHAKLAGRSKLFLAYCACTRPSGEKLTIAAAFTDGDTDFLMVGRNGVFYDRDGKDWDATITKIVDNPVSIRQAFWQPYKSMVRMLEERATKRAEAKAAEREKANKGMAGKAGDTAGAKADGVGKPAGADAAAAEPKVDLGMVAAIAVGLGALGSMAVALIGYVTGLFSLPFWIIVLVILALFLAISTPSMIMAWFKLRQRSLGAILDSNGWAVNGQAKISVRFGKTMTDVAKLPEGASLDSKDKYADPKSPWPGVLKVLVVLGFFVSLFNFYGVIHTLSDGKFGSPPSSFEEFSEEMEEAPAADAKPVEASP